MGGPRFDPARTTQTVLLAVMLVTGPYLASSVTAASDSSAPVAHAVATGNTSFHPGENMTVSVNVTDDSNISSFIVRYQHESGDHYETWSRQFSSPVPNGTYETTEAWPDDASDGTWEVQRVSVEDEWGNEATYFPENNPDLHANVTVGVSSGGGGGGGVPNLVVRNMTHAPTDPGEGDTVTTSYVLANEGNGSSGEFDLAREISGDQGGGGVAFPHDSMEANETENRSFQWTIGEGNWTVSVTADVNEEVDESNETDNTAETNFTVPSDRRDLTIRYLDVEPVDLHEGETGWLNYTIVNDGNESTGSFWVRECKSDDSSGGCGTLNHSSMGPEDVHHVSRNFTAQEGNWTVDVALDTQDDVAEDNETDNTAETTYSVGPPLPDIVVRGFATNDSDPEAGETIPVRYEVANEGEEPTGNFSLERSIATDDGGSGAGFTHASMDPGDVDVRTFDWEATPGNVTFSALADGGDEIEEESETNNHDNLTLHVEDAKDLAVREVTLEPTDPTADERVWVNYSVVNEGSLATDSFEISECREQGGAETCSFHRHSGLNGSEHERRALSWIPEAGDWNVTLTADADDDVEESEVTDNEASLSFSVDEASRPDIVAQWVQVEPDHPTPSDEIAFQANLTNEGTEETGSFSVEFQVTDRDDSSFVGDRSVNVSGLAPGEHQLVNSADWNLPDGNYSLELAADSFDEVNETNEQNNTANETFTVESTPAPNLVVSEIFDPGTLEENDTAVFYAEIANIGDASANASQTGFRIDGDNLGNVTTPDLAPGDRTIVKSEPWTATAGDHNLTVHADVHDAVDESNETDNRLTEAFHVAEALPNLVADVDVEPYRPTTVDEVEAEIQIHNTGEADAGSFEVELFLDGDRLIHGQLHGLSANSSFETSVGLGDSLEPGEHQVTLVLDGEDEVAESEERDNRDSDRFLVVLPPDPAVTGLNVSKEHIRTDPVQGPANPIAGQEVEVSIADLGPGEPFRHAELHVVACPEDPVDPLPALHDGCEEIESRFLDPHEIERGIEIQTEWDTLGKAGDWTICATLDVRESQLDHRNDERCEETFVAVGGTGLGGIDGR